MPSCLVLERVGRGHAAVIGGLLLLLVLPNLPLLIGGVGADGPASPAFATALATSLVLAAATAALAVALGLPAGVAVALYHHPLRPLLLAVAMLPPLLPSFLLSLGWSYLWPGASGLLPCAAVFVPTFAPLVLLASYAATRSLPASLADAARLAGGDAGLLAAALRQATPAAAIAAAFAGVLTLADPGPGLVFGVRTAASELLVSIAAQYQLDLAAQQALALSAAALLATAPIAGLAAPRLGAALSARRQRATLRPRPSRWSLVAIAPLTLLASGTVVPLVGLLAPLFRAPGMPLANQPHGELLVLWGIAEVLRTLGLTLLYALGAAAVAVVLSTIWALAVARNGRLASFSTLMLLPLLALPPAAAALGWSHLATLGPAWADGVTRGPAGLCLALGLRFAPASILLMMRARQALPGTWASAAALHGVPVQRFLRHVFLPALRDASLLAALLVALLAIADVTTALLLHPPGRPSLPLAIFTVMANAPEQQVAMLCLLYAGLAATALVGLWTLSTRAQA